MTPETENAVFALARYINDAGQARVTDKVVRSVVTEALGMQRLRGPRFEKIIQIAQAEGRLVRDGDLLKKVELVEELSSPTVVVRRTVDNVVQPPAAPTKPHHPPSDRPKHYMGALLEGRLNDQSADLEEDSRAAAIFTHCPHCSATLLLRGTITVESSEVPD